MKAFHFRLDSALRWRSTQLQLERESCSQLAGRLAEIQGELATLHSEVRLRAAELVTAGSTAFESWAGYIRRCRRRIQIVEGQLQQVQQALAFQTKKMVEAHQKLRVIENLKRDEHALWARELGRETEAFAGEAFLARLIRNARATDTGGLRAPLENPRATDTGGLRATLATIEKRTGENRTGA